MSNTRAEIIYELERMEVITGDVETTRELLEVMNRVLLSGVEPSALVRTLQWVSEKH